MCIEICKFNGSLQRSKIWGELDLNFYKSAQVKWLDILGDFHYYLEKQFCVH
jgi:hypothetical protein